MRGVPSKDAQGDQREGEAEKSDEVGGYPNRNEVYDHVLGKRGKGMPVSGGNGVGSG